MGKEETASVPCLPGMTRWHDLSVRPAGNGYEPVAVGAVQCELVMGQGLPYAKALGIVPASSEAGKICRRCGARVFP